MFAQVDRIDPCEGGNHGVRCERAYPVKSTMTFTKNLASMDNDTPSPGIQ